MPTKKQLQLQVERMQQERKSRKGLVSLPGAAILAIATLLGYSVLVPRVTISASDPVDPEQPFSSSVTITNGLLPINAVQPSIAIDDLGFLNRFGNPVHLKSTTPYGSVL